jgi:hypothetical protein
MTPMPPAFLGYKLSHGSLLIRVCASCPGRAEVEAFARAEPPVPVTHGICPACYQKAMAEVLGEACQSAVDSQPLAGLASAHG